MPADTVLDMILGFSVILGVLLLYIISLFWRTRKARQRQQNQAENSPRSN